MIEKHGSKRYAIETRCKTWKCGHCARARYNALKRAIVYGARILGASYFITLTYATDEEPRETALTVGKDWPRFLRLWKKKRPNLAWWRVMELTKKKQIHLHLIVGGLGETQGVEELMSEVRDAWALATRRDGQVRSYIVHATPVSYEDGVANYMDKEMLKTFGDNRKHLVEIGFKKRFSSSQNWPKMPALEIDKTKMRVLGYAKYVTDSEQKEVDKFWMEAYPEALKGIGDPVAMEILEKSVRRGKLATLGRMKSDV